MQKGAYVGPRRGEIGDGNSWVEGNTLARMGRGRQTYKRAYCCSFYSGFDCLRFDLVWGVHVVQCYPPIISAISKNTAVEKRRSGFLCLCSGSADVFLTWITLNMLGGGGVGKPTKTGIIQKENTHTVQGVEVENNTPLCGETYEYDSCVATRTSSLHSATKTSSCMPRLLNESTLALHQTQHYLPFSN